MSGGKVGGKGGYAHVLKYTSLFGGVQGLTMLASVIRNKVVAVAIGSVGMAFIDIYNHVGTLLSSLTTFGLSFSAVRSLSALREEGSQTEIERHIKMLRSWSVLTALLGTGLCAVLSPLLSRFAFGDSSYTLEILCLSPMVGMLAITGMEIAILKAMRRLRDLACATTASAVLTLLVSAPAYVLFHRAAIVPVLLITTFGAMVAQMFFSLRLQRWSVSPFSAVVLKGALPIIRLGLAYVLAAGVGQLAELGVRAFIVRDGNIAMEGLYCAMFTLTVSYGRFMFVTMDADYFPRLSAQFKDRRQMSRICGEQTEIALLLMAPFLLLFAIVLPIAVRVLFAESFMGIVVPTLAALFYMFFKAAVTPLGYLPLATGDGKVYFVMEGAYYVYFTVLLCCGFHWFGLVGAGVALSLSTLVELGLLTLVYGSRYGVRVGRRSWFILAVQGLLLLGGIAVAVVWQEGVERYLAGGGLLLLQIAFSVRMYRKAREL